jgi:DNA helicase II / ATP-dependent DNA helicase PcrA
LGPAGWVSDARQSAPNLHRPTAPDPWQRLAIVSPADTICCVAGAGSGKTTVLTARIALLMHRRDIPPSGIRAVTFMKKTATEMESLQAMELTRTQRPYERR